MGERAKARLRLNRIGFVFQAFHLMDELTALENVELPVLLAGQSAAKARRHATTCSNRSAWLIVAIICRRRCPADSGSASRSPER